MVWVTTWVDIDAKIFEFENVFFSGCWNFFPQEKTKKFDKRNVRHKSPLLAWLWTLHKTSAPSSH